jgi:hypothetical protein
MQLGHEVFLLVAFRILIGIMGQLEFKHSVVQIFDFDTTEEPWKATCSSGHEWEVKTKPEA